MSFNDIYKLNFKISEKEESKIVWCWMIVPQYLIYYLKKSNDKGWWLSHTAAENQKDRNRIGKAERKSEKY